MSVLAEVHLTWDAPAHEGEIDVPTLGDDPADPATVVRAAGRAFWALVAAGYGDVDDVRVFHNGEWVPQGPQRNG